jgi:hypothetical protein
MHATAQQTHTLYLSVFFAGAAAEKMCTRLAAGGDFDYGCVLGAAIMFYEAQRSGKLPASNRIPWRGNSGLQDKAPNGASIVGGWYVARAHAAGCVGHAFMLRLLRMQQCT